MGRPPELQGFLDALLPCLEARGADGNSPASLARIANAVNQPGLPGAHPAQLDVCSWLDTALSQPFEDGNLRKVVEAVQAVRPLLNWRARPGDATASPGFVDAHANAMLLSPAGIEQRGDLWIGISLLAPGTRYPDHRHAPEETYLVLSPGAFRVDGRDWFRPGVGGSFYVPPGRTHAMRAEDDAPLLAIWALWAGKTEARC